LGVAPSIGTVFANGLSPVIIDNLHWQSVFYIAGGFGITWGFFWFMYTTDSPQDNESVSCVRIDEEELEFIVSHQEKQRVVELKPSYRKILTEPAVLVTGLNHFAYNWGYYVFSSWLPTYLKSLNYDLNSTGIISFLPYILMPFIGIPSGIIADKLIASNKLSTVYVRKIFQLMGTLIPALFLILLSFIKPDSPTAVIFMIMALAFAPFSTAGYNSNFLDLTTKYTGLLYSFSNTSATIPGIIGVSLTGFILDSSGHNWAIVFLLAAFIYIVSSILFVIFAKGESIDFDETTTVTNGHTALN